MSIWILVQLALCIVVVAWVIIEGTDKVIPRISNESPERFYLRASLQLIAFAVLIVVGLVLVTQ